MVLNKNTPYIVGCVVYTGAETKVQMNDADPVYKSSKLMKQMNWRLVDIFILMATCITVSGILGTVYVKRQSTEPKDHVYLGLDLGNQLSENVLVLLLQKMGTWFLIFAQLVPISLYVTLEVVKFGQAQFMEYDYDMICMDKKMQMRVKTSNLTEELGQVEYVFSDKTGTLTRNLMEFKKFMAGGKSYGVDNSHDMATLSTIKK
jgi:magnesium-transporting ATPase (P-type)